MTAPLRIMLALDDPDHPEDWHARLVERIVSDDRLTLTGIVPGRAPAPQSFTNAALRGWGACEKFMAARPTPADPTAYRAALQTKVSIVDWSGQEEDPFTDVILDLSSGDGSGFNPASARHGVWYADAPDAIANIGMIAAGAPTSRIALFRRNEGEPGPIGIDCADLNTKFIAARNALFMREKLVTLILRALRRTWLNGKPDLAGSIAPTVRCAPTFGNLSRYLRGLGLHLSRRLSDKIAGNAGLRPGMYFLKSAAASWSEFDPDRAAQHLPETNSYYADPFLWEHDGTLFCFFEEYDYATGQGHISVGQLLDGRLSDVRPALKTDYHLSFPFLFEHDGTLFMMPETNQQECIEVWKCQQFPDRWVRHATALEGEIASDSTLNLIDGDWWLFTNISSDPFRDMNTELHIFRVDGPDLTSIEPHSANPVVMDTRCARNAGRIIEVDGRRLRPAQENSHGAYGYALKLMEIRHLSLEDYEEEEVRSILPATEDDIVGCHHFDTRAGIVIMDACMRSGGHAR